MNAPPSRAAYRVVVQYVVTGPEGHYLTFVGTEARKRANDAALVLNLRHLEKQIDDELKDNDESRPNPR